MKSILTLLLFVSLVATSFGQEKRPDNIGVGNYDEFKNNSFDINGQSHKANQDLLTLDKEIKGYAGIINTLDAQKLTKDYNAILGLNKFSKEIAGKISQLDDQGKQMIDGAKDVSPKMKSISAANNTNKSIKALEASRKNLTSMSVLLKEDANLLLTELKKRGEPVEEFVE